MSQTDAECQKKCVSINYFRSCLFLLPALTIFLPEIKPLSAIVSGYFYNLCCHYTNCILWASFSVSPMSLKVGICNQGVGYVRLTNDSLSREIWNRHHTFCNFSLLYICRLNTKHCVCDSFFWTMNMSHVVQRLRLFAWVTVHHFEAVWAVVAGRQTPARC